MNELSVGIERARAVLVRGLSDPVALREPWEEIIAVLDDALSLASAGDRSAALERSDLAAAKLKALAMMRGAPSFELMSMEDARRDALRELNDLPRSI